MPNKNGLILITPTSVDKTGTGSTATVSANGSVEFSSCATLSLNGVFSADYDNYMIVMRHIDSTFNAAINTRLRLSGTDASDTGYTFQRLDAAGTTIAASRSSSQTSGRVSSVSDSLQNGFALYFYGPFLTQPTAYRSVTVENGGSPGVVGILDYAGTHSVSTAYDGMTFLAASGTITGRIAVYGMRK